jgi:hypothetical protein
MSVIGEATFTKRGRRLQFFRATLKETSQGSVEGNKKGVSFLVFFGFQLCGFEEGLFGMVDTAFLPDGGMGAGLDGHTRGLVR